MIRLYTCFRLAMDVCSPYIVAVIVDVSCAYGVSVQGVSMILPGSKRATLSERKDPM